MHRYFTDLKYLIRLYYFPCTTQCVRYFFHKRFVDSNTDQRTFVRKKINCKFNIALFQNQSKSSLSTIIDFSINGRHLVIAISQNDSYIPLVRKKDISLKIPSNLHRVYLIIKKKWISDITFSIIL